MFPTQGQQGLHWVNQNWIQIRDNLTLSEQPKLKESTMVSILYIYISNMKTEKEAW